MPNAENIDTPKSFLVLALGYTGAGKTTNFLTLPGKKFAYLFDPNAIRTLRGHDVDYEEFLPDIQGFAVKSLAKGKGDRPTSQEGSFIYTKWEEHFEKALESGFFDSYDAIMFDSATTFLDIIMDRVLTINGRAGQWPQLDDYGPQMNTFSKVVRAATSIGKTLYFTGHVETTQDEFTSRIFQVPVMTGKLKSKIPLLFSEILFFEAVSDSKGQVNYTVQTKPDRMMALIRTSCRGLEYKENITIDFNKPLEGQGLSAILERGTQHHEQRELSRTVSA